MGNKACVYRNCDLSARGVSWKIYTDVFFREHLRSDLKKMYLMDREGFWAELGRLGRTAGCMSDITPCLLISILTSFVMHRKRIVAMMQ